MTLIVRGATTEINARPTQGQLAHAEGNTSLAIGVGSHTEGFATTTTIGAPYGHAEGNSTTVSANYGHAEGLSTTSSANYAHAEGSSSIASGQSSHAEGTSTASGVCAHSEGASTVASGDYSHAASSSGVASRYGQNVSSSSTFASAGDCQANKFTANRISTSATPVELTFNGSATVALTGNATNVLTVPINKGHRFRIDALARRSDSGDEWAAWTITGTIVRGPSGNARFLATPISATEADAAAAAWTLAVSVNTGNATNNYLAITATGEAAKTIRWNATLTTTEVG